MKIALVGYGKMGRIVHAEALKHKHEVVCIVDPYSSDTAITDIQLTEQSLRKADVVIDFSSPATAVSNILFYIHHDIKAVIGTTGWLHHLEDIKAEAEKCGATIMHSGNFSIGLAITMKLTSYLSFLINHVPEYDVSIHEVHHREKADSPSGTALMLADRILERLSRKKEVLEGNSEGRIDPSVLQITSERNGYIPGIHEVRCDSPSDTITINHTVRDRSGFALGAIMAAEWISTRQGFFDMDDFVSDSLGRYLYD